MTDYMRDRDHTNPVVRRDAERAIARIEAREGFTVTDGVMRWDANGAIPPREWYMAAAELLPDVDAAECERVHGVELDAFLAEYRRNPPVPDGEMMAEMRAEFGAGAEVVDVISGRRTRL